jgi:hypothetical protein
MDKDVLKGVAIVVAVIIAVSAVFLLGSRSGPQKAQCIADALKAGVAYADIDKTCHLSQHSG